MWLGGSQLPHVRRVMGEDNHRKNPLRRPCGRPKGRWRDELDMHLKEWTSVAQNREVWKEGTETFAQQWDNIGLKKIAVDNKTSIKLLLVRYSSLIRPIRFNIFPTAITPMENSIFEYYKTSSILYTRCYRTIKFYNFQISKFNLPEHLFRVQITAA